MGQAKGCSWRVGIGRIFTLSQLDDCFLDALGDLTILALQLAQLQESNPSKRFNWRH
jgi:hypothetical protein